MLLTQEEIDSVLTKAETAVQEIAAAADAESLPPPPHESPSPEPAALPPERVQRILNLRVPVIVRLARRSMRVRDILQWGRGTIVEFNTRVDTPLDLMVNNCVIGNGEGVKVGEKFGLRIHAVGDAARRHSLDDLPA